MIAHFTPKASLAALLLFGIMALPGCQNPFSTDPLLAVRHPEERLRNIGTLSLDEAPASADPQQQVEDMLERQQEILQPREQFDITLEEARALTLANNLDLKVQLINPTIARQSITEEEARFESLFTANGTLSRTDTPTSSTLSGSQAESESLNLGVNVPLRTGGNLTANLPLNRFETNNIFSTLNPAYTTDLSISISQPLLRGAGVRTNTHGIRIASYQTQISEAQTKLEVIRIIAAVDRVYWRLYAARRALVVRLQEYELAVALLEQAQRRVDADVAAEVEVIRAESGVAARLEAIIIAENSVRDRQRELKRVINREDLTMETDTIVVPSTEPNPVRYQLDGDALAAAALDERMEMLQLELQLAQDMSSIDFQKNQKLPLFTLDYTYNINGLGSTLRGAADQLGERSFEDHRLGMQAQIPIGNEAAKARLHRAIYTRMQRLATREARELQIRQEVYNAVDQLEANWQRVLASRQNAILNARTLAAEQRQFQIGVRTATDVLDAQTSFAAAQLSEIQALVDYQVSQVDIAFATGTLLGASQVRWDPID